MVKPQSNMTGILIKKGYLDTETSILGEYHVNVKEKIRVMLLQAKECQRLPANNQAKRRDFPLTAFRRTQHS